MDIIEMWIMAMLGLSAVIAVGAAWFKFCRKGDKQ